MERKNCFLMDEGRLDGRRAGYLMQDARSSDIPENGLREKFLPNH
jgi:hypothetical protein